MSVPSTCLCKDTPYPKMVPFGKLQTTTTTSFQILIFICLPGRNWRSREVDIVRLCKLILNVRSVTKVWFVSSVLHLKDLLLD